MRSDVGSQWGTEVRSNGVFISNLTFQKRACRNLRNSDRLIVVPFLTATGLFPGFSRKIGEFISGDSTSLDKIHQSEFQFKELSPTLVDVVFLVIRFN